MTLSFSHYYRSECMHREGFLQLLRSYSPSSINEQEHHKRMLAFVEQNPDCFRRELLVGHITGSAWIINQHWDKALLTHHRKLDKWLQLGGHCDGEIDVLAVALREAEEESGIEGIVPVYTTIFDIDVHSIPEYHSKHGIEPEHLHYDVRFLMMADDTKPLRATLESKALQWIQIEAVPLITTEPSIMQMLEKTLRLKKQREMV